MNLTMQWYLETPLTYFETRQAWTTSFTWPHRQPVQKVVRALLDALTVIEFAELAGVKENQEFKGLPETSAPASRNTWLAELERTKMVPPHQSRYKATFSSSSSLRRQSGPE